MVLEGGGFQAKANESRGSIRIVLTISVLKKKRCNVLCDAYVVATADFCHSFYFMIKLYGHK